MRNPPRAAPVQKRPPRPPRSRPTKKRADPRAPYALSRHRPAARPRVGAAWAPKKRRAAPGGRLTGSAGDARAKDASGAHPQMGQGGVRRNHNEHNCRVGGRQSKGAHPDTRSPRRRPPLRGRMRPRRLPRCMRRVRLGPPAPSWPRCRRVETGGWRQRRYRGGPAWTPRGPHPRAGCGPAAEQTHRAPLGPRRRRVDSGQCASVPTAVELSLFRLLTGRGVAKQWCSCGADRGLAGRAPVWQSTRHVGGANGARNGRDASEPDEALDSSGRANELERGATPPQPTNQKKTGVAQPGRGVSRKSRRLPR